LFDSFAFIIETLSRFHFHFIADPDAAEFDWLKVELANPSAGDLIIHLPVTA
jgi:hypothetical protein